MKTINLNSDYIVEVEPKKQITVIRNNKKPNTFKIGDMAEYDSYNLSYYGEIVSITEKTVTIANRYDKRKYRLKLDTFAWRNFNFNLDTTIKENSETMNYI